MYYIVLIQRKNFDTIEIRTHTARENFFERQIGSFETPAAAREKVKEISGGRARRVESFDPSVEVYEHDLSETTNSATNSATAEEQALAFLRAAVAETILRNLVQPAFMEYIKQNTKQHH